MPDLTEAERELAEALNHIADWALEGIVRNVYFCGLTPICDEVWKAMRIIAKHELTRRQQAREEAEHER